MGVWGAHVLRSNLRPEQSGTEESADLRRKLFDEDFVDEPFKSSRPGRLPH